MLNDLFFHNFTAAFGCQYGLFTFTFLELADTKCFIQTDLQLLYMSEVARLWSNRG